ncbi:MAG TPA: DUF692 domain-containing protein [Polyangia bacterium]|jgi:hypothetical protein|nr:DUF692 domain-containing protein [Polyangia bacterium]
MPMTKSLFPNLGRGLGLRREHYRQVVEDRPAVGWFEVISENFMVAGGNPRRVLDAVRRDYPVVLHGVSLSIGSTDPLDERYLAELDALARATEPAWISDHLCWGTAHGINAHDLLPLPYTEEALAHAVRRVERVQERLGRRILLENPSSYLVLDGDMAEHEFLAELARRADCGILLDVNNVFVSARNHGWDAHAYLAALPAERIGQIHLAGHSADGALLIDTHDGTVCDEVWQLYAEAIERFGPRSTMIEWDADVPAFEVLERELVRAAQFEAAALGKKREETRDAA